jgi:hypothetical protein
MAVAFTVVASCAPALFVPPAGPGEPEPEAASAWAQATSACRGVRSYSAALRLSGRAGDQRIPSVGAIVAVTASNVHLQLVAGNRPRRTLAGSAERATYFDHDNNRVVTARAEEIFETVIGIKAGPDRLLALLSGCATRVPEITRASRFGKLIGIETADGRAFLEQRGTWQIVAGTSDDLVVEYRRSGSAFPTEVRLASAPGRKPIASIRVTGIDQLDVNADLKPEVFAPPKAAAAAVPMTLDELRAAGPLGGKH